MKSRMGMKTEKRSLVDEQEPGFEIGKMRLWKMKARLGLDLSE